VSEQPLLSAANPPPGGDDRPAESSYVLWLILSILSAFFCCQPVGIAAAIFGVLAYVDYGDRRLHQGEEKLRWTRILTLVAAALVAIPMLCFGIFLGAGILVGIIDAL